MSNGQRYHRDSMTCAHLRYPLGTWLRVRNMTNGKEVIVQVTDRGPYSRKFVIDLSRAAARELDIIQYGYRQVEITPFVEGKIPYRFDPPTERPELDLGYSADDVFDPPIWMEDSIYRAPALAHTSESHRLRLPQGSGQEGHHVTFGCEAQPQLPVNTFHIPCPKRAKYPTLYGPYTLP